MSFLNGGDVVLNWDGLTSNLSFHILTIESMHKQYWFLVMKGKEKSAVWQQQSQLRISWKRSWS